MNINFKGGSLTSNFLTKSDCTLSSESMDNVQSVHGLSGHCPCTLSSLPGLPGLCSGCPWTRSRGTTESMGFLQTGCELQYPWKPEFWSDLLKNLMQLFPHPMMHQIKFDQDWTPGIGHNYCIRFCFKKAKLTRQRWLEAFPSIDAALCQVWLWWQVWVRHTNYLKTNYGGSSLY